MDKTMINKLPTWILNQIEAQEECWSWQGGMNNGTPWSNNSSNNGFSVRRHIYCLLVEPEPDKERGFSYHYRTAKTCADKTCVNPAHASRHSRKSREYTWAESSRRLLHEATRRTSS